MHCPAFTGHGLLVTFFDGRPVFEVTLSEILVSVTSLANLVRLVRLDRSSQPSDRCVISLGIGRKGHSKPLARLEEILQRTGFQDDLLV